MKKRRFTLSALLIMSVVFALILSVMPMSVLAADAAEPALTGTKLTTAHAGQTLSAGEYYVEPGATLTLRGGTGKSGLAVAKNSTVTIHIPAGSTLNVYGGAASGTTGAGAGIEVVSGSNLKIIGSGTLNAYGGKAANGSNGASGETARWGDDSSSYIPDSGYGGSGGGGAGAGIGTKGGKGGSGTGWTLAMSGQYYRTRRTDDFKNKNVSGSNGQAGGNGESASDCGGIFVQPGVTVKAYGGAAGTSGGSGGSAGSKDYESDDHWMRGLAGGAGGGGGGAGKAGVDFGTGGGGGGGGGAGGGIGYAWSYRFLGAGGGGGGAGAVAGRGGAWSADGEIPDCKKYNLFGGIELTSLSGSSGGKDIGGSGGRGAKVKIMDWSESYWQWPYAGYGGKGGNAGADSHRKYENKEGYLPLYTVSIYDGEKSTVYYASADKFLPEKLAVQNKTGYTFYGYYGTNDVQYYDENGIRTSAEITCNVTISAKFDVNEYDYTINRNPESSGSSSAETGGTVAYGNSLTLTTPSRAGYLFRGWKISASSGNLNKEAYYTYTSPAPVMRMMMRNSNQSSNQSFVRDGESFLTEGFEKIGSSVTMYNLSADDDADLTIEEMWVRDYFEVTFKDFDGTVIGTQNGQFVTMMSAPLLPDNSSEYYEYTFKYWKCNIDGQYYETEDLPNMGAFLSYESKLGDAAYTGITFTAVYDVEYKKELHFVGSLGNENLDDTDPNFPDGVLILGEGNTNVPVVTNFKITKNDGVSSLLLIPQYDASVFNIKAISINGQLVYGEGAISSTVLNGFNVTITGTETESDMLKILLDNLTPDASTSDDIFVQIVYEMKTAIGGLYEFGFVTADYDNIYTDMITHGDRSEAYGTYDPDANSDTDAWRFNELKITVDSTAINVVVRVDGKIEITDNQSFVYNGQPMSAADRTQEILNALQYVYNGYIREGNVPLTITWYDEQGNKLDEAPKNVGTYKIGISAAQTTYYNAADEVKVTFTITPYEIFVVAGDQTLEYTGSNIVIESGASQGGIFIKDADGNLLPVDAFVNSELVLSGVTLTDNCVNANRYLDVIKGILTGDTTNYIVNYENGTLTITKAVNEWIGETTAPGGEYNGQKFDEVIFNAEFGKETAKVEYFYGYETDANGNKTEIWKTEAPVNAGTYTVRITIEETDNYNGLSTEVTFIIKKKEIHANGFTFEAIDKIYNGEPQYWSVDPNGDDKTNDAEVWLNSADAQILQYVNFAGLTHSEEGCINAGTYSIEAILQITNPNYTFITTVTYTNEEGEVVTEEREVDTCTFPLEVKILKLKIVVTPEEQTYVYNGIEPVVSQGQDYVTITLENGTVAPDYIIRDFFGGQIYDLAGDTFDPYETYYKKTDKNGSYEMVTLTYEEFENNKNAENPVQYYVLKTVDFVELLTLYKDEGVDAGTYALYARLGANSNYEIAESSGNFIIYKQSIDLPTLGSVIYNGEEQTHSVPDTDLYTIERVAYTDAGVYKVLVALKNPNNYQWIVDGAQETSDDQRIVWLIEPKEITVKLPDAEKEYTYGVTYGEIAWNGNYVWVGEAPYDRDDIQITFGFDCDNDYVFDAHTYYAEVLEVTGPGKDNYIVKYEGGSLTINKKAITKDELATLIESELKYYTGAPISWVVGDFTINNSFANVIELISVGATDHVNANGIYENDEFTYHSPKVEYFADVKIKVLSSNYKLADDIADDTVAIEVFIAKAQNAWDVAPSVNASNLANILATADPKFGEATDVTVTYFKDEDCTQSIKVSEMVAGTTYYAMFTVAGTDNYFGLSEVIHFNSNVVTVKIPVVYLENGTIIAGAEYRKPYIGTSYRFECDEYAMNSSLYTYAFSGISGLTDAGTYTITFTLNGENSQYEWEDGTTDPVVFTLVIMPANLTIKPDDLTIVYKSEVPTYTIGANGLVNGETLEDLLSSELYAKMNQFICTYVNGSNSGSYDIYACNKDTVVQDEISSVLKNYTVTFEKGILTVTALAVDYDDVGSFDDKSLEDLINNGLSFVYDSENKEVTIENLPDELEVVITYKDKNGNSLPEGQKPESAGEYKVEIQLKVKDDADIGNYQLPNKAEIVLNISKAEITITVNDQEYDYSGENYADKFPMSSEDMYSIAFTNGNAFTVVVGDLTIDNGEYINAKTYASVISINYTESDNYVVTIVKGDLSVNKVNNSWINDLDTKQDIVYDKDTVKVGDDFGSESKFGKENVRYIFYIKDGDGWKEIAGAPVNAGEYALEAYIPGNDNYYALNSALVEFTIQKAIITVGDVMFNGTEVYYNGQSHSIYVAESVNELFNVVYEGNGKTNAGAYTVTATFTPKDIANYELEGENSKSAILTINKVKITISAENKESMYGDPIADLTYVIGFVGADGYTSFYEGDWGSIVLSTTATSQSNVGTYDITAQTISNDDNYDVNFVNGIYKINKFIGNTITVEAEDVRYLMDLIYSAEALRGKDTIKYTFATSEDGEYTETLPKNVGTYYVKATIADTDNYNGAEDIASFEITKATLSAITGITYNKDTATWTAVVTTTDGKRIDCDISYLVGTQSLETPVFKATSAGNFSVIAVPSDENNYNNSSAVPLATVYSVQFADTADKHVKQPDLADLTAPAFATQYRFAGQAVTRPTSIDSGAIPTVEGYKFRTWLLENSDYNFALGVNSNITLYADWTVIKYTVTFYNDATEDKIENGVFVPGTPNYVGYHVIEVEYGNSITLPTDPTKTDDVFIYTFSHWSGSQGGSEITDLVVKGDLTLYAVYDWKTGAVTITYMISADGASYEQYKTVIVTTEDVLETLADKPWFIEDGWYIDAERTIRINSIPVVNITLYGAYVFDIGAGDVNADGEIDVDDITLYRRWIVGGYNIVSVAPGNEWNLVNSDNFDASAVYFVERVNDANHDDSGDIRDITTVRMALTGGYGYTYVRGFDSLAGVSGEGVVIESQGLINVDTTETFKAALEKGGIIKLMENIEFNDTVTIGKDTVIYLNGYELDMSANTSRPFNMASNARLVIYGENSTVKVGNYGLVNIPVGADNVGVVINGGSYVANTDNGSFIKPRGEGEISIELNDVILTDTSSQNYAIDASSYYGEKLSVNVTGGTYDVWTGFVFCGPATNEIVFNDVTIECRYLGVSVGGTMSNDPDKAGHVTINNSTITLNADLAKNNYSQEIGCVIAGYGSQIKVNDSTLSSNVHIASICSGDGNCVIEINDCTIIHNPVNQSYAMYEFLDEGEILVSYHVSTEEAFTTALANGGTIILEADIALDQALVLNNGKNITIDLNAHTLTMANVASNYAAVVKNGTLTIEGEGTVIVPGLYGFGTASDTTTGHIVINGGTFIGDAADYLFACYNGSVTINGGSFTANYCVLNNFPDDGNGNTMTGTATVNGGEFQVTGTDEQWPSSIFFGDVNVNADNLA